MKISAEEAISYLDQPVCACCGIDIKSDEPVIDVWGERAQVMFCRDCVVEMTKALVRYRNEELMVI